MPVVQGFYLGLTENPLLCSELNPISLLSKKLFPVQDGPKMHAMPISPSYLEIILYYI